MKGNIKGKKTNKEMRDFLKTRTTKKKQIEKSETLSEECNRKDYINKVQSIFLKSIELSISCSNLSLRIKLSP